MDKENVCPKHGLQYKWRKDKKGKFCVQCTHPKSQDYEKAMRGK